MESCSASPIFLKQIMVGLRKAMSCKRAMLTHRSQIPVLRSPHGDGTLLYMECLIMPVVIKEDRNKYISGRNRIRQTAFQLIHRQLDEPHRSEFQHENSTFEENHFTFHNFKFRPTATQQTIMQFRTMLLTFAAMAPAIVYAQCDLCTECVSVCNESNCNPGNTECNAWCTDFCSGDLGCQC
ncbi:uncharacterized protein B0I36DRAFT_311196 [Microdochium trichocladiopsis]|uniref:Uncharacterized protein n=1 Tax=Microdochium trichocladiopsis TaxID=1682393 RepID=A0A9P9C011_9PEZI|nr:uncharacterized protein B0I36DRAFT_311196 [Microdochium trichocladiopsis]KAH7040664.1 hypothetical protein B0I36DRAFT_311196 [Microdochium trichocladiopsis]